MCYLLKAGTELRSGNTLNNLAPGFLQMPATTRLWFPQKHFFFELALRIFLRAFFKKLWIDFKQFGMSMKIPHWKTEAVSKGSFFTYGRCFLFS